MLTQEVEVALLLRLLEDVLFDRARRHQPVDVHLSRLPDAVGAVLCARMRLRAFTRVANELLSAGLSGRTFNSCVSAPRVYEYKYISRIWTRASIASEYTAQLLSPQISVSSVMWTCTLSSILTKEERGGHILLTSSQVYAHKQL